MSETMSAEERTRDTIAARQGLSRSQQRDLFASQALDEIADGAAQQDYKAALREFAGTLVRNGLVSALAMMERAPDRRKKLLEHLASARLPGLDRSSGNVNLLAQAQRLAGSDYMFTSRQVADLVVALQRLAEARFREA